MFALLSLLLIPVVIYFAFYFQRIISFFYPQKNIFISIICFLIAVLFVYPARNFFSFWAVIVLHLFAFSLLTDMIMWLIHKKKSNHILDSIYRLGLIPLLCVCILLGYGYINMKDVHVVQYTIETQKQLSQNYKVAFISDLHFPNTMNKNELIQYCNDISKENPDFVLLGGDIVDERTTLQQMQQTFQALSTIQNQYGIYYVYGNHDQALYASQPSFTPEILKQTIEQNNIYILCDNSIRIHDEITLIGRDDRSHQRASTSDLLQNVSSDDFLLLMDHQPVELDTNNHLQIDLQVSGHTHGGQMFPVGILSEWLGFGEMNYGYRQLSHMQVVVSSGIAGWGYPLRTGSQSEYLIINIQSQS